MKRQNNEKQIFFTRILIFYLKRWQITKNAQGELQSVSKEDHPIDCSMEINVYPFCSSTTSQPVMIDYVHDLPNLKELLKQRDFLDIKRSKIEQIDSTINSVKQKNINQH